MVRRPGPALTGRSGVFSSPLRSPRLTTHLGTPLAVAFGVCFVTGLISHLIQHPAGWFTWPSRPTGLYRVTQGVHVATGLATIPLLAAKLWSVYPRLFRWPPVRDPVHAVERLSIAALVAAALFEIVTGVLNISLWYAPMPFFFPSAHYWVAWLAAGAILTHVGVKLPVIRGALRRDAAGSQAPDDEAPAAQGGEAPAAQGGEAPAARGGRDPVAPGELSRRGLFGAVAAAAGAITVTTVGQTVAPLSAISVLAPRLPRTGPQRLPVNKSARAAGVVERAGDPAYRLEIAGPARTLRLALTDLAALPQHTASLPIACVEGWSAAATWTGVRLRDLAELAGADPEQAAATVESLQRGSRYATSTVNPPHLADPLTLLATRLHGAPLHLDHGYPCRLIAPNRPGVLQTKWVARITIRPAP